MLILSAGVLFHLHHPPRTPSQFADCTFAPVDAGVDVAGAAGIVAGGWHLLCPYFRRTLHTANYTCPRLVDADSD